MSAAPSKRARLLDTLGERLAQLEVPPQLKKPLRYAGYPLFACAVAIISFAIALPRDKVRERLEFLLSQDPTASQPMGLGMDVKAGDLSLSILGRGVHADNVVLRTRPLRATDKPARFVLDGVDVRVGLLGLIFQRPTYDFAIEAFQGSAEGSVKVATAGNAYEFSGEGIVLSDIQGLQTAIGGLPLEGRLEGKLELDAPGRMLSASSGSLEINITGAAIGDGKAKLVIPSDPFLSAGITIPKIRLGKIDGNVTIEKGKARIETLRAHSPDAEVTLEGYLDLRDPFPSSQLHLFLRIKLSEELLKREATLGIATTSLQPGKRPDAFFGAQITGSFSNPRFEAQRNPPQGVTTKFAGEAPPAVAPAAAPAPAPPTPAPAAGTPSGTVPPPPPPPEAAAPPVDVPPPEKPTEIPKDGPIPPPPAMRGATRALAAPAEGAPPAPPPAAE